MFYYEWCYILKYTGGGVVILSLPLVFSIPSASKVMEIYITVPPIMLHKMYTKGDVTYKFNYTRGGGRGSYTNFATIVLHPFCI